MLGGLSLSFFFFLSAHTHTHTHIIAHRTANNEDNDNIT